jgi:hypothetical protein
MGEVTTQNINSTLEFLRGVSILLTIFAVIGPVIVAALLWNFQKTFATKREVDGQGGRITAYETMTIQNRERADHAHERLTLAEEKWTVELRYIRRDLDTLLQRKKREP